MSILDGPYKVSSPYGWRVHPVSGEKKFHHGVDLAAAMGTQVRAVESGIVYTSTNTGYGNLVTVTSGDLEFRYGHLSVIEAEIFVYLNGKIGLVGSTGVSTGPHLHFEVRRNGKSIDPMPYVLGKKPEEDKSVEVRRSSSAPLIMTGLIAMLVSSGIRGRSR